MKSDKLSIIVIYKKTNYFIFKLKQKRVHMNSSILYNRVPFKQVKEVNFLGVDEALTWKSHINNICKNIAKSPAIMQIQEAITWTVQLLQLPVTAF